MSAFDPDVFMNTQVVGANATKVEACPVRDAALAVVDKVEADSFSGTKDPSKTYHKLSVLWSIDEQDIKDELGRDKVTVKQDMFLDLTDGGTLDMGTGKNVSLGRLREALGQNDPSKPWAPPMLVGNVARVKIEHEIVKGETYARVTGVTKA
jgi:hypothetical protein